MTKKINRCQSSFDRMEEKMKRYLRAWVLLMIFILGIFSMGTFADTEYMLTVIQDGIAVTTNKFPGTTITLTAKSEKVIGWTVEEGGITLNGNSFTMPYNDVVIRANYEIEAYSITYNLDGGSVSGNPTSYTEESEDITLKNPTKLGHTFIGWTGSNGNTPELTVTIPKGSTEIRNIQQIGK